MLRSNYLLQFNDKNPHQDYLEDENNEDDNYVFNSSKPIVIMSSKKQVMKS